MSCFTLGSFFERGKMKKIRIAPLKRINLFDGRSCLVDIICDCGCGELKDESTGLSWHSHKISTGEKNAQELRCLQCDRLFIVIIREEHFEIIEATDVVLPGG